MNFFFLNLLTNQESKCHYISHDEALLYVPESDLVLGSSPGGLSFNKRQKTRKDHQEWTIQRLGQHWVHNTQHEKKTNKEIQYGKLIR